MVNARRTVAALFALVMASAASMLAAGYFFADGAQWHDYLRIGLLALTTAWLAWGAGLALVGLFWARDAQKPLERYTPQVRTAVLVPIYNEEPSKTFSHVAAMIESLADEGVSEFFEFAVLSDTTNSAVAVQEEQWFARLKQDFGHFCPIYYRRRSQNIGKKAGNIEDFIKTSGARYEYLIILDADSLMEGATMVEMVARMDADPQLGLLQTLPKITRARSVFGRGVQFSASYYSPVFARGVEALQGNEGPFWGHNAITRTRAFAQSCGLPVLPGKPPLGGHILSHDYVEAALLAREGWKVVVHADLQGSYEEGPDNIIDFAKRDRRWCQGNLQHTRIIGAHGLRFWSRFTFVQGVMAYVAAPLWAMLIIVSIIAPIIPSIPDYFPAPGVPVFPRVMQENAIALITGVLGLLLGPKLLIFFDAMLTRRNRQYGGSFRAFSAILAEILMSSIVAPILMLYQTRSVIQVLSGADSGWPAANREAGHVSLREAWAASWWISLTGLCATALALYLTPEYVTYLLLITVPQVLAPLLISLTSRSMRLSSNWSLFSTREEHDPTAVISLQHAILQRWRGADDGALAPHTEMPEETPGRNPVIASKQAV